MFLRHPHRALLASLLCMSVLLTLLACPQHRLAMLLSDVLLDAAWCAGEDGRVASLGTLPGDDPSLNLLDCPVCSALVLIPGLLLLVCWWPRRPVRALPWRQPCNKSPPRRSRPALNPRAP